ncbi:MAG: SAM-dependent methyltransferase, partial [Acidobacteriia bacterium]|nr:SAM-dependent methyltransferase [Terriglobia bacterium]
MRTSMSPVFALLLFLFAASGCAALIYEIVWFQLLELVIGSSAVSLGTLLATYMGGMFLGSVTFARMISARHRPLRVYAAIEAGIGACGLAVLFGLPLLDRLYAAHAGHGLIGIFTRAAVCALCLLVPTMLMGASLPALARQWKISPHEVTRLGLLYGANTLGAVAGSVLAGFYLLRVTDMAIATYVAAGLNACVALAAFAASRRAPVPENVAPIEEGAAQQVRPVYIAIALSGLCALGA